jgi:PAS domain S-box-containing protein
MLTAFLQLFSSDGYMPHGMCLLWEPNLLRLHIWSDALIGLSYFSMPLALLYFAKRRSDFTLSWVLILFGVFILACGTTHFMSIWTLWHPDYVLDGTIKALTAAASIPTAVILWVIMPGALAMPNMRQLSALNTALQQQVSDRVQSEFALSEANRKLVEASARLEQSQREAEALSDRLALGTEAGGIGVWEYDILAGTLWRDERMHDLFDLPYGDGDANYKTWIERVHPDDRDYVERNFQQSIRFGTPYAADFRVQLPSGQPRTLRSNGKVSLDARGKPMRLSGISYDVTDLRQREQAAATRALERFQRVVEAAPNAMVMTNAAGQIEMVNSQAEKVFGYPRQELLGQPVEMLVPERFHGHHPGLRDGYFHSPQSRPMGAGRDLFGRHKDGSEFPVEIGLNPIETEDGTMVLSAIVDISDRRQKEQRIRAALKEKDLLLSEIHHRVKNNLQIIHSLLDLQSLQIDDPAVTEMLRASQNRVRSMSMIHQTLYQSKDFARVSFASFLDTLLPALVSSYSVTAAHIDLSVEASEVHLPISAAIPCGLILNELISNALKHAFPNGRAGSIRVELRQQPDDQIVLIVSDNGIGIPLSDTPSGSLGLELVNLLAEQLSGSLTIHRANPTRFELRFPGHSQ